MPGIPYDQISLSTGQFHILVKSSKYTFDGDYSFGHTHESIKRSTPISFDYVVCFKEENFLINPIDLAQTQQLFFDLQHEQQVDLKIGLISSDGTEKLLIAKGRIFDYQKNGIETGSVKFDGKENTNILQSVFDASPNSISIFKIIHDLNGGVEDFEIQLFNAFTLRTTGLSKEQVIGKRYGELFPTTITSGVMEKFKSVAITGKPLDFDKWYEGEGMHHWFRFTVSKVDDLLVVTTEDITQRKKSEQDVLRMKVELQQRATGKYLALLNSVDEAFCNAELIYNDEGRCVDIRYIEVNLAFEKLSGVKNPVGKTSRQIFGDVFSSWFDIYSKVLLTDESIRFEHFEPVLGKWFDAYAFRIDDTEERHIGVLFTDITARKDSEDKIHQNEARQVYLLKLSDAIRPLADPLRIQRAAALVLGEHLSVNRAFYSEIEQNDGTEYFVMDQFYHTPDAPLPAGLYPVESFGEMIKDLRAGLSLYVNNVSEERKITVQHRTAYLSANVHSFCAIPLIKNDKLVAILGVHQINPRTWTKDECTLMDETAERTWAAVEWARAESALRQVEEKYRTKLEHEVKDRTAALMEQSHFIKSVVETIPDMVSVINLSTGKIEYINAEASETLGYSKEEMMAMLPAKMNDMVDPDYLEALQNYFLKFLEISDDVDNTVDYRAINKRGEWLWFRAHGKVFNRNKEGIPTHCVNVVRNITEYKKSLDELLEAKEVIARRAEYKYLQLFNSIDEGFCIIEMLYDENNKPFDYRYLEGNPAFRKLTDFENPIGKTIKEMVPDIEEYWPELLGQVARTGKPIRFIQYAKAMAERWYEVYAFPAGGNNKNHLAVLFTDITERKNAEQGLKELNRRLEEIDKAKTEFFSNISHEFRTPLTLLLGPLEDVIKKPSRSIPRSDTSRLQMAYRNGIRLQKLVNTLLDFAAVEAGKVEAFYQPTNLSKFTVEIASNFRSAIEKAGLTFSVKAQKIDEHIYVNRDMWEKITLNLLSNAFKFTLRGKIEVQLRNRKKHVELRVRDTGIGVSFQNQHRIFERFARVEGVKARTYEGSGIGLALVKELVASHSGKIKVKSKEGLGSEFIISIPKGKAHLPPGQIFETTERLPSSLHSTSFLEEAMGWLPEKHSTKIFSDHSSNDSRPLVSTHHKPTILLADDNADMRQYLHTILSRDFTVLTVENGRKVVEYVASIGKPDLVLADVMMPEMDGHALVSTLKSDKKYAKIPIILLSARSNEEAKIEGMQHGADDYLIKPFSSKELLSIINARIQIARIRDEAERELNNKNIELEKKVAEQTVDLILVNESLNLKNQELKSINETLTNFAFTASRDLRELLVEIEQYSSELVNLETSTISETGNEEGKKILTLLRNITELIDRILEFSKTNSANFIQSKESNPGSSD